MTGVDDRLGAMPTVTLSVVQGPGNGKQYRYTERTTAIVGRAEDCDPREALVAKPRITVTSAADLAAALRKAL
jgi:hypothetical protein